MIQDKRQNIILNTIIQEHIKTGAPVGSNVLVNKYKLDISSATARNEMAELEEQGYITHPYTSAGRVPTESAYYLYIKNLKNKKLSQSETKLLKKSLQKLDELHFKQTAKKMAQILNNTVFWVFEKNIMCITQEYLICFASQNLIQLI